MAESYSHLTSFEPDVAVINGADMDWVLQELAAPTVTPYRQYSGSRPLLRGIRAFPGLAGRADFRKV